MRLRLLSAMALTLPLALYACGGDDDDDGGGAGTGGTSGRGGAGTGGTAGKSATGGTGAAAGKGGNSGRGGSAGRGGSSAGDAGEAGSAGDAGSSGEAGMAGEGGTGGEAGLGGGGGVMPTTFKIRIENRSGDTPSPTPVSPGVWVLSPTADPLFSVGEVDRGLGLEHIAEDGSPTVLAAALAAESSLSASGVFTTPVGASNAGPATPGNAFEFEVQALPEDGALSFAMMFGQSSDTFIGPDGEGIALFDDDGSPLPERDVSARVSLWDAGSERNEAPRMGPDQAPRQALPNSGPAEGTIARFSDTTRALPIPSAIVAVTVSEASGTFSIEIENVSGTRHAIDTPISPFFYATHDTTWSLFTPGSPAPTGLESLAEDGSPAALVSANTGATGVGFAGAMTIADGASGAGPALTGGSFTLSVTPDAAHPWLSFGSMVGTTNDAFLALGPSGVRLLDAGGAPRAAAAVEADIRHYLAVWDAGTEQNQVPGIGPNQAARQPAANTGPADPDGTVRLYADATNDLAGPSLGGFASIGIVHATGGDFTVTVTDTAGTTAYPGRVAPLAWALHDAATQLFSVGGRASPGLERLAEDGNPSAFQSEIAAVSGVGSSGVVNVPNGSAEPSPLSPGQSFVFTVTPDAAHRFFNLAEMIAPSNDTFLAFDPGGIALLDAEGAIRSDSAIATDIAAHLYAWDAGTEANQAGAAGPDQIGRQAAPNTGAAEGNGFVRSVDDPIWPFPPATELVKVTILPLP